MLIMSYWNLKKRNCVQYRRHFLVDNGVFHGKLAAFCIDAVGSCMLFLTALLFHHSGCKYGLTVGLNQEPELTCLWIVIEKPHWTLPTAVSNVPHLNNHPGAITFYLPSEFMSVPFLFHYTVNYS